MGVRIEVGLMEICFYLSYQEIYYTDSPIGTSVLDGDVLYSQIWIHIEFRKKNVYRGRGQGDMT